MTAAIWKTGTSNAVTTTLDGSINSTDATIALTSSSGLQYPGVIVVDRVDANDVETPLLREYISYTGISGNSLTGCARTGLGGSTAQSHSSGAKVEEVWSITHWNDFLDAFTAEHSTVGVHSSALVTSLKASGAVVTTGTSDVTIVTPKALADAGISLTASSTNTFTNKRITKRVTAISSSATPTINTDNCDVVDITALGAAINTMSTNLSGTPTNKQLLEFEIKDDGTARAITWGASFVAGGVALPTTTVLSKILVVLFQYSTANSLNKWRCIGALYEA